MKEAEWTENRLQGEGERKEALKEKIIPLSLRNLVKPYEVLRVKRQL